MRNEYYEDITGSLVHTYSSFRVYRLMEMAGRDLDLIAETDKHHLIVLVNDQDEAVEAIWHYDSRVDLPWVVYAIKQRLRFYEQLIEHDAYTLEMRRQPLHLKVTQAQFDKMNVTRGATVDSPNYLSAARVVQSLQNSLDRRRAHHQYIAQALHELEAAHPEGIPDVSSQVNAEREQQRQHIEEGQRVAASWRKHVDKYLDKGINWRSILGPSVRQAGPFHIYQSLGEYGRFDSLPSVHVTESSISWTNPHYMILFEDETLGIFDIWPTPYKYVPGAYQICRPARNWFYLWDEAIVAARTALSEASDTDELARVRESLAWLERIYLRVYDTWVALDCPDAPADDSDPVFDPSTAVIFDSDQQ